MAPDMKAAIDAAVPEFVELTSKFSIKLTVGDPQTSDTNPSMRNKSKFGGMPYWPASMPWPKSDKGKDLIMLAQINFAQMPALQGFPRYGILQFFCHDGEWYNDDGQFKTVFHSSFGEPQVESVPRTTCNDEEWNDDYPPFTGVMYITNAVTEKISMPMSSDKFVDTFQPILEKHLGRRIDSIWKLNNTEFKYLSEALRWNDQWGHRIGGWPNFTQNDMMDDHYDTLLLQIDTDRNIMWGDSGIANMFINHNALGKLDFSDVLYTWDCY